jgi:hypothetical protein
MLVDNTASVFRLLGHSSPQTKLTAATALRQMCVEPSVRGVYIQNGGLKACIEVANEENNEVRGCWPYEPTLLANSHSAYTAAAAARGSSCDGEITRNDKSNSVDRAFAPRRHEAANLLVQVSSCARIDICVPFVFYFPKMQRRRFIKSHAI